MAGPAHADRGADAVARRAAHGGRRLRQTGGDDRHRHPAPRGAASRGDGHGAAALRFQGCGPLLRRAIGAFTLDGCIDPGGTWMIARRQFAVGGVALALGAAASVGRAGAQAPRNVLRAVPQAEPQVFDPHQSQANVTSVHAAMIYDTLFSWDADMVPRPQMVESWTKSDDRLLYTFTLRPGLMFHDDSPVTSRDVIATLRRMFVRDSQNQIFARLIESMDRVDDRTFTLRLKEPFNYVEFLLGGSNGVAGAIMREREALTDPFTPVKELIGSGPFRFNRDEYKPGARLVYDRFGGYVPRGEPASGFAGGKIVKVDRVEL